MYMITGLLGMALITAPYLIGYTQLAPAYWTSIIVGGVVAFVSIMEWLEQYDMWEYWIVGMLGLSAVAAPYIFGFSGDTVTFRFMVSIGAALVLLSGVIVYEDYTHHGFPEQRDLD